VIASNINFALARLLARGVSTGALACRLINLNILSIDHKKNPSELLQKRFLDRHIVSDILTKDHFLQAKLPRHMLFWNVIQNIRSCSTMGGCSLIFESPVYF